jgi:SAM-dependent methyltransferase
MRPFDFGKNWILFSSHALTNERIDQTRSDFKELLKGIPLKSKTFLDIGFGQGLSLLCALEMGATVTGCDINPKCRESLEITAKMFGMTPSCPIVIGSILSDETIGQLRRHDGGTYDIVHSWGVLHHTGAMHRALDITCGLTASGGHLIIAIYNRHWSSAFWKIIKYLYCYAPFMMKQLLIAVFFPVIFLAKLAVTRRNPLRQHRGMDFYYDIIDWVGGYPYEYASIMEIVSAVEKQGFECIKVLAAEVPTGCNQFVFKRL